MNAVVVVGG